MKQPEALRLADELETVAGTGDHKASYKAAAELRRLHQSEREGWRYAEELEQERKRLNEANQAMLEALKKISRTEYHIETPPTESLEEKMRQIARAAVAKGEQS